MPRKKVRKSLFAVLFGSILLLSGCGVSNPFCSSARPVPVLTALSPNPANFAQVQDGLTLTLMGSHFYSESIVMWNEEPLATTVISSTQLQVTVTTAQMQSPGSAQIFVHTPPNLSGDLGCNSGGDSQPLTFTVNE